MGAGASSSTTSATTASRSSRTPGPSSPSGAALAAGTGSSPVPLASPWMGAGTSSSSNATTNVSRSSHAPRGGCLASRRPRPLLLVEAADPCDVRDGSLGVGPSSERPPPRVHFRPQFGQARRRSRRGRAGAGVGDDAAGGTGTNGHRCRAVGAPRHVLRIRGAPSAGLVCADDAAGVVPDLRAGDRRDHGAGRHRDAYRDGARAPRYAIMAGREPLKRRDAGTPLHLLPLDEAEVEGHLPREDQPPPVARACDRRAWQHPPRGHPDDLLPNAAAQDDTVASNFDVIKRHPLRSIDHDPSRSGSRVGSASCTPLGAALVGAVRGRIRELSTPYASFDGGCKGRRALLGRSAIVHSRSATPPAMGGVVSSVMCRRTKL